VEALGGFDFPRGKSVNQSTIIFGYLAAAFLIFIIQRGELPVYWGFLVKSPATPSAGPSATGSGAVSGSSIGQKLSTIETLATVLG
jgi:hypothetical protein